MGINFKRSWEDCTLIILYIFIHRAFVLRMAPIPRHFSIFINRLTIGSIFRKESCSFILFSQVYVCFYFLK